MITVNEIKKKSENVYEEYLRSIINNEVFFPKVIRSNKSISSDFNEMRKELSQIIEYSKDRRGYGYTISYKQVNTRQHGNQSIPDEISFQLESDFLKYFVNIPGGSSLGDGTSGTVKFTITGTGGQDFKWIAISVLRGQYFKPGNYSDSLTMTLTY